MPANIDVLVAAAARDLTADGIAAAVATRKDMTLAANRVLTLCEADALLRAIPPSLPCAIVIVGLHGDTEEIAERWLHARHGLAVLRVDVIEDIVQVAVRNIGLDALLAALRKLAEGLLPGYR